MRKTCKRWVTFSENLDLSSLTPRGEIISWRGASCLQTLMTLNLAFDFGRNKTTLSEFIGSIKLNRFSSNFAKTFQK